jgi:sulfatase maturation enzyme AslB (radical SAM superfamily)
MGYKSCKWISSGIVFNQSDLAICCYGDNVGGGRPPLTNNNTYHGDIPNYNLIFEKKERIRELQRKGETFPPCEGCEFLHERNDWDKDTGKIRNIVIQHSPVCNCKCIYCYTEQNKDFYNTWKPYNVLPVIKDMIQRDILEKGAYINIAGGEPTILEEFEELTALLLKHDCFLDIFSSGIKFSQAISDNMHTGRVNLTVSIDSGCAETYQKIKQINAFPKVVENLRRYAENQYQDVPRIRTKYIIVPQINDNIEEVSKWLHLNADIGIKEIMLDIEANYFTNNRNNIPKEYIGIVNFVQDIARELNLSYFPCLNVIQALKTV